MKRTIGICVVVLVLVGALVWGGYRILEAQREDVHDDKVTEKITVAETETAVPEEERTAESMTVQEPFLYILRETDGMLVVYEQDGVTVWMETGIRTEHMEPEVVKLFQEGVTIRDERELYDLLESYSS